eukprot:gnl/TRDRNA2_/TRDRNA2_186500_c0_seq1.p1 gnl/TRDRNA2_/TRDRNA2_186500_c0~~gnl/TRDRNA2_/TRDRNA2_186500_c0_seq1.p1  ORF type:complete len:388 (-),score=84.58 gnl/TRDRNA2_/TRDRNA2_186500_c0_seq1:138-1301(-)
MMNRSIYVLLAVAFSALVPAVTAAKVPMRGDKILAARDADMADDEPLLPRVFAADDELLLPPAVTRASLETHRKKHALLLLEEDMEVSPAQADKKSSPPLAEVGTKAAKKHASKPVLSLVAAEQRYDSRIDHVAAEVNQDRNSEEDARLRSLLGQNGALEEQVETLQGTGKRLQTQLQKEQQLEVEQQQIVIAAQRASDLARAQVRQLQQIVVGFLLAVFCALTFWWCQRSPAPATPKQIPQYVSARHRSPKTVKAPLQDPELGARAAECDQAVCPANDQVDAEKPSSESSEVAANDGISCPELRDKLNRRWRLLEGQDPVVVNGCFVNDLLKDAPGPPVEYFNLDADESSSGAETPRSVQLVVDTPRTSELLPSQLQCHESTSIDN